MQESHIRLMVKATHWGKMATFVLAHGAWHGGWCWNKVTSVLRCKGATAFAPTLSGLGEKAHLANLVNPRDLDLRLHIQDVARLLEYEDLRQVILVGHAYAGMVITGVAEKCPERLAHLVYVNGFVPSDGEAMVDLLPTTRGQQHASWVRGHIERGDVFLPPPASREEIQRRWGITDPDDLNWMFERVTPHPAAAMAGPIRVGRSAAKGVARSFVCGAESGFRPVADRVGKEGWEVYHIDSGLDPMISHPRELADILLEIGGTL